MVEEAPVEDVSVAPEVPEAQAEAAEEEAAAVEAPEDPDPEVDQFGEGGEAREMFFFVVVFLHCFVGQFVWNDVWVFWRCNDETVVGCLRIVMSLESCPCCGSGFILGM